MVFSGVQKSGFRLLPHYNLSHSGFATFFNGYEIDPFAECLLKINELSIPGNVQNDYGILNEL
jgi:hypothetical protein